MTQEQITNINIELLQKKYYETQTKLYKLTHSRLLKYFTKRKQKQLKQHMTNTLNHATANYKRHNPTNNTYQITDGTETITINAQQILKQAAKHTNDKNTLKHLHNTIKHIQQDIQQHGPRQGLLHPNDRTHTTKHKELKEFIQKSAETSRLNRETYMKKSQEIQDRIDKHRRRAKEYLSQLP